MLIAGYPWHARPLQSAGTRQNVEKGLCWAPCHVIDNSFISRELHTDDMVILALHIRHIGMHLALLFKQSLLSHTHPHHDIPRLGNILHEDRHLHNPSRLVACCLMFRCAGVCLMHGDNSCQDIERSTCANCAKECNADDCFSFVTVLGGLAHEGAKMVKDQRDGL